MIKILKHQAEFLQSEYPHTGLVAGFGSGKSIAGTLKTIEKLKEFNKDVAYYLPTYDLIKTIAFKNFKKYLKDTRVPYKLNETAKVFETPIGNIYLRSIDKPEYIIGYEVAYSLVDEADIPPQKKMEDVLKNVVARNRLNIGVANSTDFISTPEGYKFMYDFFVKKPSSIKKLIRAKTSDNPFLPPTYIENLKEIYDPNQLDAYLNGDFVNLTTGNVYHRFDREVNYSYREIEEKDIIHIGMDFNITRMCAISHVIDKDVAVAVDEFIDYYDTEQLASHIKNRYKNHRIVIYPDASGNSRKSSASKTDIEILKTKGFIVKVKNSNPAVKDRINTINKMFERKKYFININKCPIFTEHLETLGYKNGEPDKSINHSTDGAGYFIWYNYGKKRNTIYI